MAPAASTRSRIKRQTADQRNQQQQELCDTMNNNVQENKNTNEDSTGCSTPKAKRFRIPEVLTCPPAPKKRRVMMPSCSAKRSPIAFFASPDIELFFFSALRKISA